MKDFRKLKIWERAHRLVIEICKITKNFPKDEIYGMTSQIRRSSSSIPTNIAEGCGRDSDSELKRFLVVAMGSASEFEYQLILARDLQYLSDSRYQSLQSELVEIRKMLNSFIQKLKISSIS